MDNYAAFNQPWWGGQNPNVPSRQTLKLARVTDFNEVKKRAANLPVGSEAAYFHDSQDIVYVVFIGDNGKPTYYGFNMYQFDIDAAEAKNHTVTEGRLNEAMTNLESRIGEMFNQLKEEMSNGQHTVRTEESANANRNISNGKQRNQ